MDLSVTKMERFGVIFLCFVSIWASPFEEKHVLPVPFKSIGSRIVNGEKATLGQFPYQVGILQWTRSSDHTYFCGGSIISEKWILTSAHCVYNLPMAYIYSGAIRLTDLNRFTSTSRDLIVHEDFDPVTLRNDIGLIRLNQPLVFDENTQPIALAWDELEAGTEVTLSGWGQVSDTDTDVSDSLNYITVSAMDNSDCAIIYGPDVVQPGLVCLDPGDPLKSPCFGDSGGPVVVNADTQPVQVAVLSFLNSYGCEFPYPSGNTRVAYYKDWIVNHAGTTTVPSTSNTDIIN